MEIRFSPRMQFFPLTDYTGNASMRCNITLSVGILIIAGFSAVAVAQSPNTVPTLNLPDATIVTAFQKAATQNILPSLNSSVYPGYWCVCADGQGYGYGNSYPTLDGGQMTNALLVAGQVTVVKQNFDYIKSFMKPNGLLPLAILPGLAGQSISGGYGYSSRVDPNGGLYVHWVPENPLGATGSTTYIQNADAIFRYTHDTAWLNQQLASVNSTADYLASLTTSAGAVAGAGYYTEFPSRSPYDGVTQSYAADAFQRVAALNTVAGNTAAAQKYQALADKIISNFQTTFWSSSQQRFAQYDSARGFITNHGLTDTDWGAIAFDTASPAQKAVLVPQLQQSASAFYYGGMPGGIATLPSTYQDWECSNTGNRYEVAAMGRAWTLQAGAWVKMGDGQSLVDSISAVAQVGKNSGYYWMERYNASGGYGAAKYNEYPANLMTIVEHDLLGVNFGLDGSLEIKPTAPISYWTEGFGQTLTMPGGTLQYLMFNDHMTGSYFGTDEETLRVWLPDNARSITVNGVPFPAVMENGELVFVLPAASVGQPCLFEVSSVPEPSALALLSRGRGSLTGLCLA